MGSNVYINFTATVAMDHKYSANNPKCGNKKLVLLVNIEFQLS